MKWVCRGIIYQHWNTEESKNVEVNNNLIFKIFKKSFFKSSELKTVNIISSQDDKIVYNWQLTVLVQLVNQKLPNVSLVIPVYNPEGSRPKRAKHVRGIELDEINRSQRLYLNLRQGSISLCLNRYNSLEKTRAKQFTVIHCKQIPG